MLRFLSRHNDTVELRGPDHYMRLARHTDFAQWRTLRQESRRFLQPWEPLWHTDDLTYSSYRLKVTRANQEYASGMSVGLLLFDYNDKLLGGLTIGNIRRGAAQACMIGYWMGEKYAHNGHMSAALRLVIPYIFNGLQLHRIEAACIPDNTRSIHLLEKAGFQREGLLRHFLKINGEWRDHTLFSLVAGIDKSDKFLLDH